MRTPALIISLLAGCSFEVPQPAGWIAPFDGQTSVARDQDLVLTMREVTLPADYDLPSLLEVTDLADGGRINGTVTASDREVRFSPSPGLWRPGRQYAWTLYDPYDAPHGPEFSLPVVGTSVFTVDEGFDVLEGSVLEPGLICLLLSAPVEPPVDLTVWVADVSTNVTAEAPQIDVQEFALAEGDLGAGAVCFDNADELVAEDVIRVGRLSGDGSDAPAIWRITLSDLSLDSLLAQRRGTPLTASEWGMP